MSGTTYQEIFKIAKEKGVRTTNHKGKLVNHATLAQRVESRNDLEAARKEMTELYKKRGEELADRVIV